MGFLKARTTVPLTVLLFILISAQLGAAIRPWQGEQLFRKIVPNFESLQRGPVPPSGGSPCSNVPGGTGKCINGINAAGHLFRSPPPHPAFPAGIDVIKFAAAATSMGE
ncbi:hypothetical protein CCACVL1_27577 [Corchorus capsularis]|uniref:Uncharacterized protein n=1 Tax=Corchorus capsularis TaxID=210143 RepID=A0A1R3G9L9_COCAP|nr:hypothetical protein CCACVL1_27577 [Corchorus capsularis]